MSAEEITMDRREFLISPALATAAAGAPAQASTLAGHLTMAALAADSVRVAMCSRAVSARIKEALGANPDLVRLGGLLKLGASDIPARAGAGRALAMALGAVVESSAARHFEPALGANAECDLYRDVTVMREMSAGLNGGASAADIGDLLLLLDTRRLIGIHTFSPDAADTDRWLTGLIRWRRDQNALLKRYAQVYAEPDPELVRKYVSVPGFYGREDGLIRLARGFQRGSPVGPSELAPALQAAASSSQYARALKAAHDALASAGGLFTPPR